MTPRVYRPEQQHGQAYMPRLLEHARRGELDPSFLATPRFSLEDAPTGYRMFKHREAGCVRAVFTPQSPRSSQVVAAGGGFRAPGHRVSRRSGR